MPFGATYCHSGPSWPNSQLRHVLPLSVERPQPLPTVAYHTSPLGPNANPLMKLNEIECALVSREYFICSQVCAPRRNTKMPSPYVPTQIAESGARASASTWTPKPLESGSAGIACAASEGVMASTRHATMFRLPRSAFRVCLTALSNSPETIGSHSHPRARAASPPTDRKSTRLNSSHPSISYAVSCL